MVVKTVIEKASVYRRSAVVTKRGKMTLESGRNTVFISGLTASSMRDTVRLSFSGKVKALDINYISASDIGESERPETSGLERKISEIDKQIEIYAKMKELRETNACFKSRPDVSVEAQERVLSELPEKLLDIYKKTCELLDERKSLEDELSGLQAVKNETVIKAELSAEEAGTYDLEMQYVEMNASWMPLYEIRYSSEKQPLEVLMKATIRQNTREDWNGISLMLYTGNPTVSNALPVLDGTKLSLLEPMPVKRNLNRSRKMMPNGAMPLMAKGFAAENAACYDEEVMLGDGVREAVMEGAVVSKEETMTCYELPGKRDVIRDSEGNSAELQRFEVNARYKLLTVPSMDTRCFMAAVIKNSEWPLPAAQAKIYIKDAYAGQVYAAPDPEKDEFELSLGVDERLTVSRKASPEKTTEVFLKGTKKKQREFIIRLSSTSPDPLKVVVKDSIPVSTDKGITVDTEELSGGKLDEKEGFLTWERDVTSEKAVEIRVAYSISWPKDKILEED